MKGQDYKPTFAEKLFAQWPGAVGLGFIGLGLGYIWYANNNPPHVVNGKGAASLFGIGIALLGYWGLANDTKSNF